MLTIRVKKLTKNELINKLHFMALTFIFFSGACLYNLENSTTYIAIIVGVTIYTFLYCFNDIRRITKPTNNRYFWWIVLLFIIYTFYGTFLPIYSDYNVDYMLFIALIVINVIFLFSTLDIERCTRILIKASAYSSIFICIFIGVNEWSNILAGNMRIGESGSGNVNTVGMYLGMLSIPIIYKLICKGERKYLFIYTIQIIFMFLTGSKKVLLFIIVSFLLLLILKNRLHLHRYFIPIFIGIFALIAIMNNSYFYDIIGFRVVDFLGTLGFNVGNYQESHSTDLRLLMYQLGWEAFKQHPLLGGGYFYFSHYSGLGTYTHNNYLELLVNYGLFGFVLYYSMIIYIIKKIMHLIGKSDVAKLYFTLIVAILITDTAAVTFSMAPLNYIILLFAYLSAKYSIYGGPYESHNYYN